MKSFIARVLAVLLIAGGTMLMLPFRPAAATTVNIPVGMTFGQTWFCSAAYQGGVCPTTVSVGDTVNWVFNGMDIYSLHTTKECGASCNTPTATPLWDSGAPIQVGNYSYMFTTPGVYYYQCNVHTNLMRGTITVAGSAVGGQTQLAGLSPRALQQPTGPVGHVGTWFGLAAIAGGVLTLTGTAWVARRRLAG